MAILEAKDIHKSYGKQTVLNGIDLTIKQGEIFGFLGPNGAGKTTFIKIMLGLAMPQKGELQLMGEDIFVNRKHAIKQVGAVVEAPIFFDYLTAYENLYHIVSLSGPISRQKILDVLELVGLSTAIDKKVGTFSYGMKQRLGIAQALLPDTKFLILDEPTNGLDPHGISGVRSLIRKLRDELGITIFLSSHLLIEVEQVCDRVCIIHHGNKVFEGVVAEVTQSEQTIVEVKASKELDCKSWNLLKSEEHHGLQQLTFELDKQEIPQLVQSLIDQNAEIFQVRSEEPNLEELFINLTKDKHLDVRIDSFGN
ncbi:MAG: ABC transporter ATP-binding protein [Lentisphaeria bacterium]|nr:ABC transporter ATP-binding protein [Lentisphaeria bacterium]